jgi:glycosyltransferase involved in cell wall biosynthesis
MTELSVIIPYCNEWPQVCFTIRSIAEELHEFDFEIIAVDNWCEEVEEQGRVPDRGHDRMVDPVHKHASYGVYSEHPPGVDLDFVKSHILAMSKKHEWLRYVRYEEKLSHWNAKNAGVAAAKGQFLWFMDSHVILGHGVSGMFKYYRDNWENLNGTMHLPWTYHILESRRLIYKTVLDHEKALYHYSTKTFNGEAVPFKVPVMTTCGMLMARQIYDRLGGWPRELGIYGGGENFINYCCAVMGISKWIWPYGTIHHHGDRRGYNWNYDDYHRNRMIAVFMHSGIDFARRYIEHNVKGSKRKLNQELMGLHGELDEQFCKIQKQKVIDLKEWWDKWKRNG